MAPTQGVSTLDSLINQFEALFAPVADRRTSKATTKQTKPSEMKGVELTSQDILSVFQKAATPEQIINGIGSKAESLVLTNWKNELEKDLTEEVAKRSVTTVKNQSSSPGSFWGSVKDFFVGGPSNNDRGILTRTAEAGASAWNGVKSWFGFGDEVVSTVSGVSTAAETTAVATAESTLGTATTVLGGVYGAYNLIKDFGQLTLESGVLHGAAVGAAIGSAFSGPAIGGLIGAIGGGIISLFRKSGKHKDQKMRDKLRDAMQNAGIIDRNWSIGLADGSRYDLGVDGGPKKEFGGRRPFEVDLNNPSAVKLAMAATPLAFVITGGHRKLASDLSGYLANASLSNAGEDPKKAAENLKTIIAQFKVPPQALIQNFVKLVQAGALPVQEAQVYLQQMRDVFAS